MDKTPLCPICNKKNTYLYWKSNINYPIRISQIQITDHYFGLHGDLFKCRVCSLIFISSKSYIKRINQLYKKMSDEIYLQEEKERRLTFVNILTNISKLSTKGKLSILDIGCCTGGLLVEARLKGWDVYGLDPSKWACDTAKRIHNLSIINTTLDNYNPGCLKFNAITLIDVLEHVDGIKRLLKKIHTIMADDGVFCIVTPDISSKTARIFAKKWWGIRIAHLSYFNFYNLHKLISQCGFKIINRKTYTRYFTLYYILVRIFPFIDKLSIIREILKKITIPLTLHDTFELYLTKNI